MSLFGSAILERLHNNSPASNPNNDFYKVFDNSVGEWLDNFDVDRFHEQLFLQEATGEWLNVHGKDYGVNRHIDETDEHYFERIVKHTLGRLTPELLKYDFNIIVLVDVIDSVDTLTLTSDNMNINNYGFIVFSDAETVELVEKSFIINEAVRWFVV